MITTNNRAKAYDCKRERERERERELYSNKLKTKRGVRI